MGQPQRNFDSPGSVIKLKGAGFSQKQATVQAEALLAILDDQLLTKQDMHKIEMQLNNDTASLSSEIKEVDTRLSAEINSVEIRLNTKIQDVETRLTAKIEAVETKLDHGFAYLTQQMESLQNKLLIKLGSGMVVLMGLMLAFLKAAL